MLGYQDTVLGYQDAVLLAGEAVCVLVRDSVFFMCQKTEGENAHAERAQNLLEERE